MEALAGVLIKLAGVYILSALLAWLQAWTMAGVTQRTVYRLRQEVDRKLGRMPLRTFDTRPRGDLLEPRDQRHRQHRTRRSSRA